MVNRRSVALISVNSPVDRGRCSPSRQRAILKEGGPEVQLIVGQGALHQQVGGAAVMDEQLRALARAAEDSGAVTVRVLPFDVGAHVAAGDGSLAILQFDLAPDLELVHLGGIGGGVCLEAQNDPGAYARAFERLRGSALSPRQSVMLLRGLAGFPPS
jgi:hypothetical protein